MPIRLKPGTFLVSQDIAAERFFRRQRKQFFFIYAQEDELVEVSYVFNPIDSTLERYADGRKQICLGALSECNFSYSDGKDWKASWEQNSGQLPRLLKIDFKFKNETKERDFVVNIPVSP